MELELLHGTKKESVHSSHKEPEHYLDLFSVSDSCDALRGKPLESFTFMYLVWVTAFLVLETWLPMRGVTSLTAVSSSSKQRLELYPFQRVGVEKLVSDRRVLLADEMGLGKTIQCIEAINILRKKKIAAATKILVICPKNVIGVWQDELDKWLEDDDLEICVGTAKKFPTHLYKDPSGSGFLLMVNYEICNKHELLQSTTYDILICDEAHYLKSIDSQRTQAILGSCDDNKGESAGIQSKFLWLLTDTPIMNRPIELYPLVCAIAPKEWDLDDYRNSYCNPQPRRWGMDYNGASNLAELSLRSSVKLDHEDDQGDQRELERQLILSMMQEFQQGQDYSDTNPPKSRVPQWGGGVLYDLGVEGGDLCDIIGVPQFLLERMDQEKVLGIVTKARKGTALRKVPRAIEILKDAILSHKVVVFCHHRAVIAELMSAFPKEAVCVKGGMDPKLRSEAVTQFQTNPDVRLFVRSIRAAGVGITLTAASHVVFLEFDWSPATMQQAEDRCHRVTQKRQCAGTIDAFLARQLVAKQSSIAQALDASANLDENSQENNTVNEPYVIDFGKHRGVELDDLSQGYLSFLLNTDNGAIWKSRPLLWRALFARGLVSEAPPPPPRRQVKSRRADDSRHDNRKITPVVDYTFEFGKHKGTEWGKVPDGYQQWVLREKVWESRPRLQKALVNAGVLTVSE